MPLGALSEYGLDRVQLMREAAGLRRSFQGALEILAHPIGVGGRQQPLGDRQAELQAANYASLSCQWVSPAARSVLRWHAMYLPVSCFPCASLDGYASSVAFTNY